MPWPSNVHGGQTIMKLRIPSVLLFGPGRLADVPAVLGELGVERPLVVTDPGVVAAGIAERLLHGLKSAGFEAEVWDGVAPDPMSSTRSAAGTGSPWVGTARCAAAGSPSSCRTSFILPASAAAPLM
jgi:alcohol dehydrogenase